MSYKIKTIPGSLSDEMTSEWNDAGTPTYDIIDEKTGRKVAHFDDPRDAYKYIEDNYEPWDY